MASILGDVFKTCSGLFLFQDIDEIKWNPKKFLNFTHFWRFAPLFCAAGQLLADFMRQKNDKMQYCDISSYMKALNGWNFSKIVH